MAMEASEKAAWRMPTSRAKALAEVSFMSAMRALSWKGMPALMLRLPLPSRRDWELRGPHETWVLPVAFDRTVWVQAGGDDGGGSSYE